MTRRPPSLTRPATLFPYPTLFRSLPGAARQRAPDGMRLGPRDDAPPSRAMCHQKAESARDGASSARVRQRSRRRMATIVAARRRAAHTERPASAASGRSEEHTYELQSIMRTSYALFCLKKKKLDILNSNSRTAKNTHTDYYQVI